MLNIRNQQRKIGAPPPPLTHAPRECYPSTSGPRKGFYQARKLYWSWNNEPIRIKSSSNEPIGNKEGCQLIWRRTLLNIISLISFHLKGSRQWEHRWVRNVSICPNLARTAAIEVRFSINFAVVFDDFNVFPCPPSKPKLIGDVPMNRQNAAARRIFFFSFVPRSAYWRNESSCIIRRCVATWKKKSAK